MLAKDIEKLKHHIDVIDLLKHLGNSVHKNGRGWLGKCPFHAAGTDEFLEIDPKSKLMKCDWCEKQWDMFDYVGELKKLDAKGSFNFLKSYYEKQYPAPEYTLIKQTKHEIVLDIESRSYQLTGFNLNKLNDLRLTIKLSYNYKFIILITNLGRVKSKYDFVLEAKEVLLISEDIIKDDLLIITGFIENTQRETIERIEEEKENKKKVFEPTGEEKKKALNLLKSKDLLTEVLLPDMQKLGYEGMEDVIQLLYLGATSRKLDKPLSILQIGRSASGKSLGQDMVLMLMPDDEYEYHTCLSPTALSYYGKYDLANKILCVDEMQGFGEAAHSLLRSLLSKGMTSKAYTAVNKLTAQMQTEQKEVHGPVAMITSATNDEFIDDETRSRFLVIPMDESEENTRRIIRAMSLRNTKLRLQSRNEQELICRKHKSIQKCLNPIYTIIPDGWVDKLAFNSERLVYRRKYQGYLSLLFTYVIVTQYQRKIYTEKDSLGNYYNYSELTQNDIHAVNKLVDKIFSATMDDLSPVNRNLLLRLVQYCKERAKETQLKYFEINFTRREIREFLGWDELPTRRSFEKLYELEYIRRVFGNSGGRYFYKLNIESDDERVITAPSLRLWYPN